MSKELALSTAPRDLTVFAVDDEKYEITGIDIMSKAEEAEMVGLFARYANLAGQLAAAKDSKQSTRIAGNMYETRMDIICALTTLPREVALRLPLGQQIQLLNAIRAEVLESTGGEDDDDESPGSQEALY